MSDDAHEVTRCLNCDTPAGPGPYCTECGQEHTPEIQSLRALLREALDELFSLDSKILRSLLTLLFRPGRLTTEYLAGRRQRYVGPTRLYLLCSIAFFLSYAVFPGEEGFFKGTVDGISERPAAADSARTASDREVLKDLYRKEVPIHSTKRIRDVYFQAGLDSIWIPVSSDSLGSTDSTDSASAPDSTDLADIPDSTNLAKFPDSADSADSPDSTNIADSTNSKGFTNEASDSTSEAQQLDDLQEFQEFWAPLQDQIGAPNINISTPYFGDRLQRRAERLSRMEGEEFRALLNQNMIQHLPKVVFVLLPLFAAILKVLYVRRGRRFVAHLVFALHLHAFAFVVFLVGRLGWPPLVIGLAVLSVVYQFLAWRRVYEQGVFKTFVKMSVASMIYTVFTTVGMGVAALLALLTM